MGRVKASEWVPEKELATGQDEEAMSEGETAIWEAEAQEAEEGARRSITTRSSRGAK